MDVYERTSLIAADSGACLKPTDLLVREALKQTAVLQIPELFIHPGRLGDATRVAFQNSQPEIGSQGGINEGFSLRLGATHPVGPIQRLGESMPEVQQGREAHGAWKVDSLSRRDVKAVR